MGCRFCANRQRRPATSLRCTRSSTRCWPSAEVMQQRPSHVGVHGHGRPLLNTEAVLEAINCLCSDLGMAQRQINREHGGPWPPDSETGRLAPSAWVRISSPWRGACMPPTKDAREEADPTAHAYPIAPTFE